MTRSPLNIQQTGLSSCSQMDKLIPYSKPYFAGTEAELFQQVLNSNKLSGNGPWTQKCHEYLKSHFGAQKVLLTTSATAALEMAALLLNLGPGDEVIMPSYTFVSTANAVVLRGATPVFVDVNATDLNLSVEAVRQAITAKTKAIMPIHYAGAACDWEALSAVAKGHGLPLVVDGAQVMGSTYNGRPLGSYGDVVALSFHDTKNVVAGEGGALVIHNPEWTERAEILWEKGTNRSKFLRGEVDKYTWVDVGSSFLPSELTAALLWSQLQHMPAITEMRRSIWNAYQDHLKELEAQGRLQRPQLRPGHNAQSYFVLLDARIDRERIIRDMKELGVVAVSHYVPLHSSMAGRAYGRASGSLDVTNSAAPQVLRLPVWAGMTSDHIDRVVEALKAALKNQERNG